MKESYTQLLVHLDTSAGVAHRLDVARTIAQAHGAAVTALYAVTPALLVVPFAPEAGPGVASALQEIDDERRASAHAMLEEALSTPGVHAEWAEVSDFPIVAAFARQALYADLLVLGQSDPQLASAGVPFDFPETVMATSGKPALILPYAQTQPTVAQNIVIAWKPTRESARAVSAAVPLLQRARTVHVLSWSEGDDEGIGGARLSLDGYLKLRGIEPIWHRETGAEPPFLGEMLLSRAFDLDADLLVMGCYGHSRAREWVLGGTSRTVLRSMTLPVLMAH